MTTAEFIDLIKSHDIGRVFWLNLAAQLHARMLHTDAVKRVLEEARDSYVAAATVGTDEWKRALSAIFTCARPSEKALDCIDRAVVPLVNVKPNDEYSTVVGGKSFFRDLGAFSEGFLDAMGASLATSRTMDPVQHLDEVHKELELRGQSLLDVVDLKAAKFPTRKARFWASHSAVPRKTSADGIVSQLGLSHFKKGDWVIELVFSGDGIGFASRPSAFCADDVDNPRFRGVCLSQEPYCGPLLRHGTTVDLAEWPNAGNSVGQLDGLPEVMCPQRHWADKSKVRAIEMVGKVNAPPTTPSNAEFATYLETHLQLDGATQNRIAATLH
jgi:hypothetical protein